MAFPTDDIYPGVLDGSGPRSYGPRGLTNGIAWHTTEGADASRDSAVAIARMQSKGGSLYAGGGSYNFIIYDGGLLLTVGYRDASGGLGTGSASWAPERYPFLKEQLSAEAYRDPNKYLMNVAFSGKTGVFKTGAIPQNMIDTAARLVLWVEAQDWARDNQVQCGHLHWQTNRSDPSFYVLDRIKQRAIELSGPPRLSYEERITAKVLSLRASKPLAAERWVKQARLTQEDDGKILTRSMRLTAEAFALQEAKEES